MADRAGGVVSVCAVEGCEPDMSGCGLLRIAPQTTLEQAYDLGCGHMRYLVDVWPHEEATA